MARFLSILLVFLVLGASAVVLPGCSGVPSEVKQQYQDSIDELATQNQVLDEQIAVVVANIADMRATLDTVPPGDYATIDQINEAMGKAQAELAKWVAAKDKAVSQLDQLREDISNISDEGDGLSANLDALSVTLKNANETGLVPAPISVGTSLLAIGLAAFAEARRKRYREDRDKLVFAVDVAKKSNPQLAEQMHVAGPVIRSTLGPATASRIDKVRKTG